MFALHAMKTSGYCFIILEAEKILFEGFQKKKKTSGFISF